MSDSDANSVDQSTGESSLLELAGIVSDSEAEEMRDALQELRDRPRNRVDGLSVDTF